MNVTQAALPRDTILHGDALSMLRTLPSESVQCCVSSPPYWSLRDYGTATWEGGDPTCEHKRPGSKVSAKSTLRNDGRDHVGPYEGEKATVVALPYGEACGKCGAHRVDNQLGLEATPDEYVARMVEVFREVKRVLRNDGTCWINLGDSYGGDRGNMTPAPDNKHRAVGAAQIGKRGGFDWRKQLLGMPWRLAFALQADGWYLRADIIWAKKNAMPESVSDRPTKSHEYLFLLSKRATYYYDAEAIREPHITDYAKIRAFSNQPGWSGNPNVHGEKGHALPGNPAGRNKRSVWTVATHSFPGSHFATFPPKLIEPCILAGSASKACEHCGAPWRRVTSSSTRFEGGSGRAGRTAAEVNASGKWAGKQYGTNLKLGPVVSMETTGWQPTCRCADNTGSARSVVLDPFFGAGTVGVVCRRHSRHYLGIELNAAYIAMAETRIASEVQPVLWTAQEAG